MDAWMKQVEQQLKELAEGTDRVRTSEFFKEYLEVMGRFWNYSFHNQLLIHMQYQNPTRVAGFRTWRQLGRSVRKGQRGIRILAPYKRMKEEENQIMGFFPVTVFDVSQTVGKDLPDVEIVVKGDDKTALLEKLKDFCTSRSIKLDFKDLGVNGLYGYSAGGKIAIDSKQGVNAQVNTLLHEIAHELLHKGAERGNLSREMMEIQAEGTCFVVANYFHMETKSFDYLALWDADYRKIMENLKAIAGAAKVIIAGLKTPSFFSEHVMSQNYIH